jgi:hypothetical protein
MREAKLLAKTAQVARTRGCELNMILPSPKVLQLAHRSRNKLLAKTAQVARNRPLASGACPIRRGASVGRLKRAPTLASPPGPRVHPRSYRASSQGNLGLSGTAMTAGGTLGGFDKSHSRTLSQRSISVLHA